MPLNIQKLEKDLQRAFDNEVLDDFKVHPAEEIISNALSHGGNEALECLTKICLDSSWPCKASSVLRILGRFDMPGTQEWRVDLVSRALLVPDIEISDAAVQAVEQWKDRSLLPVLEQHRGSVPWFDKYIRDVIEYLKEE